MTIADLSDFPGHLQRLRSLAERFRLPLRWYIVTLLIIFLLGTLGIPEHALNRHPFLHRFIEALPRFARASGRYRRLHRWIVIVLTLATSFTFFPAAERGWIYRIAEARLQEEGKQEIQRETKQLTNLFAERDLLIAYALAWVIITRAINALPGSYIAELSLSDPHPPPPCHPQDQTVPREDKNNQDCSSTTMRLPYEGQYFSNEAVLWRYTIDEAMILKGAKALQNAAAALPRGHITFPFDVMAAEASTIGDKPNAPIESNGLICDIDFCTSLPTPIYAFFDGPNGEIARAKKLAEHSKMEDRLQESVVEAILDPEKIPRLTAIEEEYPLLTPLVQSIMPSVAQAAAKWTSVGVRQSINMIRKFLSEISANRLGEKVLKHINDTARRFGPPGFILDARGRSIVNEAAAEDSRMLKDLPNHQGHFDPEAVRRCAQAFGMATTAWDTLNVSGGIPDWHAPNEEYIENPATQQQTHWDESLLLYEAILTSAHRMQCGADELKTLAQILKLPKGAQRRFKMILLADELDLRPVEHFERQGRYEPLALPAYAIVLERINSDAQSRRAPGTAEPSESEHPPEQRPPEEAPMEAMP